VTVIPSPGQLLGNSLLCSQQVKLLCSKFTPRYANPCSLVPLLSQTASAATDGEQQQKGPRAVSDSSCRKVSLAQGAQLQLWQLMPSFACVQDLSVTETELFLPTRGTLHYITSNLQAGGYPNVYSSSQISISPVRVAMGLSSFWKRPATCLQPSNNSAVTGKALL